MKTKKRWRGPATVIIYDEESKTVWMRYGGRVVNRHITFVKKWNIKTIDNDGMDIINEENNETENVNVEVQGKETVVNPSDNNDLVVNTENLAVGKEKDNQILPIVISDAKKDEVRDQEAIVIEEEKNEDNVQIEMINKENEAAVADVIVEKENVEGNEEFDKDMDIDEITEDTEMKDVGMKTKGTTTQRKNMT